MLCSKFLRVRQGDVITSPCRLLASWSVPEAAAFRIEEHPLAFGFACAYSARLGNDPVPVASDAVERELAERRRLNQPLIFQRCGCVFSRENTSLTDWPGDRPGPAGPFLSNKAARRGAAFDLGKDRLTLFLRGPHSHTHLLVRIYFCQSDCIA
jgi:hypothetical protein